MPPALIELCLRVDKNKASHQASENFEQSVLYNAHIIFPEYINHL